MRLHTREIAGVALIALVCGAARAQSSASYGLSEQVFNAGGNPTSGSVLASVSFRIRLDSIGEGVSGATLASASYQQDGGFVAAYPPPREALNLRFGEDNVTLTWDAERSVGTYSVYRDVLSALGGLGYGTCLEQELLGTTTSDAALPVPGSGYFYLVTAENRLDEEGTKGFASSGAERMGTVCP